MVSMHFELILAAASDSEARLTRYVDYGDASHGTKRRNAIHNVLNSGLHSFKII